MRDYSKTNRSEYQSEQLGKMVEKYKPDFTCSFLYDVPITELSKNELMAMSIYQREQYEKQIETHNGDMNVLCGWDR